MRLPAGLIGEVEMLGFSESSKLKLRQYVDTLNFDHFLAITDETGMLQFSKFSIPDRRLGYTTDDNARALVVSKRQYELKMDDSWAALASKFLSFLMWMQRPDGSFHNFMSYTREVSNDYDSGDHLGRVLWATGCVVDSHLPVGVRASAKEVFDKALPWAIQSTSPRVVAHAIKGLCGYLRQNSEDENAKRNLSYLVNKLVKLHVQNSSDEWRWFEGILSYENWRLPESLFQAFSAGEECLEIAVKSLEFLIDIEFRGDMLIPIGSEGWYPRNGVRTEFDQLPVEAGSAVEALATAAKAVGSSYYWDLASKATEWYHGTNLKAVKLYDARTGACCDGITPESLNLNQGAESTLSYLLAVTRLQSIALGQATSY